MDYRKVNNIKKLEEIRFKLLKDSTYTKDGKTFRRFKTYQKYLSVDEKCNRIWKEFRDE
jgi:hypothetical protein